MARTPKRSIDPRVEALRPYLEGVAKKLADDLFGPHGPSWGTSLTELEDIALDARALLSAPLLQLSLDRQATAPPETRRADLQVCPTCQRAFDEPQQPEARCLQTRAGDVDWDEPRDYCNRCRRAFFPQSKSLGVDRSRFSPALQAKLTYAGVPNTSYARAEQDLDVLAELAVSDKEVRRLCKKIGDERVAERDAAVADYQAKPLTERKSVPAGVTAPAVAVVGVDGGRLQILERTAHGAAVTPETPEEIQDDVAVPAVETKAKKPLYWREDKIGLLLSMTSDCQESAPCPEIPASFVNAQWIPELAKELGKRAPPKEEDQGTAPAPPVPTEQPAEWQPPEVAAKQLVATRRPWAAFGPLVATWAWSLGFWGAGRKAFLGDGADNNWTLWRNHFSSFEPILDFIQALTYVFHAAWAGRAFAAGWSVYDRWIRWVWSGEVERVIAELASRQAELGAPSVEAKETSPAQVVSRALGYLQNHKDRMRYAEYRRQGLPLTSSYVESAVKQFKYRVKGTEKFWREEGAEEILQLRADHLSDDDPMGRFWQRRQAGESGQARHKAAR